LPARLIVAAVAVAAAAVVVVVEVAAQQPGLALLGASPRPAIVSAAVMIINQCP